MSVLLLQVAVVAISLVCFFLADRYIVGCENV